MFFAPIYVLTHSPNLGAAHDSIYYLRSIETGTALLHPHHLLYNHATRFWLDLTGMENVVRGAALLNALAGAAALALMHAFLSRTAGPRAAVFWTMLYGISFGTWFYATTIEVYHLPLPLLLTAFGIATLRKLTIGSAVAIGCCHGMAILFHQTNILFTIPLLWLLARTRARLPIAVIYLLSATVVAGIPYLIASSIAGESLAHWSTLYWRELDLGHLTWGTIPKALIGAGRFFIGGHFAFALDDFPAQILREHYLADERYLVRHLSAPAAMILAAVSGAWFLSLGIFTFLHRGGRSSEKYRTIREALIVWFLTYAVFFVWWEPANVEFWIATMLPAMMALAFRTSEGLRESRRYIMWLMIPAALSAINYFGSIRFLMDSENDYYLHRAQQYQSHQPGETVTLDDDWILGPYIERLTGARVVRKESQ